jgi:hypothetical protein
MNGLQLKTDYNVPFFHSNTRTEFRIPSSDKIILTNMRLVDFGAVLGGMEEPTSYSRVSGVYSLIKNIYLYSGSVLIDQMRDCSKYMSIKNQKSTSADIYALNQRLLCSNNVLEPVGNINDPELSDQVEINANTNQLLGRIPLSQIFGLLRATDTFNMWNDLRLVIEYNTAATDIFQANNGNRPVNWTINTPLLATDELVVDQAGRDAMMKQGREVSLVFQQIDRERWYVPADSNYYSQRLRAFDSHTLSNLVIQVKDNAVDDQLCTAYSYAIQGEKTNLVVNGRKLLPYQGADTPNKKLAMFQDSFGGTICFTGENDILNPAQGVADHYLDNAEELLGKLSYFGCDVLNRINTLDVEYTRFVDPDAGAGQLELWAFGSVSLYLKKSADGKIVMGYM